MRTWTSEYFKRHEFACHDHCGFDTVDAELLEILTMFRRDMGVPVTITSGCRCTKHNRAQGGSPGSLHLQGRAADFRTSNRSVAGKVMYQWFDQKFPTKFGLGLYLRTENGRQKDRLHFDTRSGPAARWSA